MRDVARQHPSPMLAIQPVFPETSFFENMMMGDLKWVFIKCKSVSRCFCLVSFVSISKNYVFGHPQESVGTMKPWTTPPNRKAKPMLPEVAGEWFFSGRGKIVLNHGEVVLTKNQLSTPFMWKKTSGNLCWSLKCFEHQFFLGGYGRVGWGDGPILLTILNVSRSWFPHFHQRTPFSCTSYHPSMDWMGHPMPCYQWIRLISCFSMSTFWKYVNNSADVMWHTHTHWIK